MADRAGTVEKRLARRGKNCVELLHKVIHIHWATFLRMNLGKTEVYGNGIVENLQFIFSKIVIGSLGVRSVGWPP